MIHLRRSRSGTSGEPEPPRISNAFATMSGFCAMMAGPGHSGMSPVDPVLGPHAVVTEAPPGGTGGDLQWDAVDLVGARQQARVRLDLLCGEFARDEALVLDAEPRWVPGPLGPGSDVGVHHLRDPAVLRDDEVGRDPRGGIFLPGDRALEVALRDVQHDAAVLDHPVGGLTNVLVTVTGVDGRATPGGEICPQCH